MQQPPNPYLGATHMTAKPSCAAASLLRFCRMFGFLAVVFVLALIVGPSDAQAHGLHGSSAVTVPSSEFDDTATSNTSIASELSGTSCVTCCASSGCAAADVPETFVLLNADCPSTGINVASTVATLQAIDDGLRRPPRENS